MRLKINSKLLYSIGTLISVLSIDAMDQFKNKTDWRESCNQLVPVNKSEQKEENISGQFENEFDWGCEYVDITEAELDQAGTIEDVQNLYDRLLQMLRQVEENTSNLSMSNVHADNQQDIKFITTFLDEYDDIKCKAEEFLGDMDKDHKIFQLLDEVWKKIEEYKWNNLLLQRMNKNEKQQENLLNLTNGFKLWKNKFDSWKKDINKNVAGLDEFNKSQSQLNVAQYTTGESLEERYYNLKSEVDKFITKDEIDDNQVIIDDYLVETEGNNKLLNQLRIKLNTRLTKRFNILQSELYSVDKQFSKKLKFDFNNLKQRLIKWRRQITSHTNKVDKYCYKIGINENLSQDDYNELNQFLEKSERFIRHINQSSVIDGLITKLCKVVRMSKDAVIIDGDIKQTLTNLLNNVLIMSEENNVSPIWSAKLVIIVEQIDNMMKDIEQSGIQLLEKQYKHITACLIKRGKNNKDLYDKYIKQLCDCTSKFLELFPEQLDLNFRNKQSNEKQIWNEWLTVYQIHKYITTKIVSLFDGSMKEEQSKVFNRYDELMSSNEPGKVDANLSEYDTVENNLSKLLKKYNEILQQLHTSIYNNCKEVKQLRKNELLIAIERFNPCIHQVILDIKEILIKMYHIEELRIRRFENKIQEYVLNVASKYDENLKESMEILLKQIIDEDEVLQTLSNDKSVYLQHVSKRFKESVISDCGIKTGNEQETDWSNRLYVCEDNLRGLINNLNLLDIDSVSDHTSISNDKIDPKDLRIDEYADSLFNMASTSIRAEGESDDSASDEQTSNHSIRKNKGKKKVEDWVESDEREMSDGQENKNKNVQELLDEYIATQLQLEDDEELGKWLQDGEYNEVFITKLQNDINGASTSHKR